MPRNARHLLALALALATLGAHIVCACPEEMSGRKVASTEAKACAGSADCCGNNPRTGGSPPEDGNPCERCNLKNRPDQIHPDRHDSAPAPEPAFESPVVITTTPAEAEDAATRGMAEDVPIPPLLQDLFHTHILLLD